MKKRFITFLSLLIVASSFFCVARESGAVFSVKAETQASSSTSTTQKPGQAEEYVNTSATSSTTESTTQTTTESTTKQDGNKDNTSTKQPTIIDWNKLTSTTKKNEEEKTDAPSENNSENPSEQESNSQDSSTTKPSTTKKKTTKKHTTTVPKMTIPVVENTQVEGTTLSPLDAYFERISGNTEGDTYFFSEPETDEILEEEEDKNLSMGAIIAICIGGIALVTCALTGLFVLRNKKASEEDADEYEYDDEYEEADEVPAEESTPDVSNTGSYKVVDYNSDDYK